jgi:hypothetical protein
MPNVLFNSSVVSKCYDIAELFGEPVGNNYSVDEIKAMSCSKAIIWAKEHGIKEHSEFYVNFTDNGLKANSSWADYQCALYSMKGGAEAGTGWNCTYPCTSTLPQCPPPDPVNTTGTTDKDLVEEEDTGSGFPWWAGLLIALFVIGLIAAGIMYAMGMCGGKKEGAKKKKRAAKPAKMATPAPAPEPAPAPPAAPAVMTAPPVYVSSTRPAVPAMAAPVYTAAPAARMAAPVATATPVQTSSSFVAVAAPATYTAAAPVTYAASAPTAYAAPVATYTAPVAMYT